MGVGQPVGGKPRLVEYVVAGLLDGGGGGASPLVSLNSLVAVVSRAAWDSAIVTDQPSGGGRVLPLTSGEVCVTILHTCLARPEV